MTIKANFLLLWEVNYEKKIICNVSSTCCYYGINGMQRSNPGTAGSDMTSDNAGSVDSGSSGGKPQVKITYFNTSAEVNTMFEDMFKRYNELFPNVIIELIPTGIGEGQQEKLQSLYASGNAPTFMNVDPANVIEYEDHLLEFTEENASWLSLASDGAVDGGTFGGKVLGAPWSVQGYALLYNKESSMKYMEKENLIRQLLIQETL